MGVTIASYYYSYQKRLFDISLAFILIVGLLPLTFLLVSIVFLTDGWPLFFKQSRLGHQKKIFYLWKIRTMYRGAEQDRHRFSKLNEAPWPMFKAHHDPRFVGIGRWLSSTGLDELPQLWNILKGEMSFIGPRPLPLKESRQLDSSWSFRYTVKPGIISCWSASPQRFKSLNHWKKLEQQTLAEGSYWSDIRLLINTIAHHWSL